MLKAKLVVRKKYKKKLVKIIGGENILSCLLNGQRINCFDGKYNKDQLKKWSSKKILLCPVCGKPYEYCHGKVVQPYFRHKDKAQCEDKYSEPETEEHLQGKRDLYEWIKRQDNVTDVILEGWIPETKQRPDIMFKYNGKQCVLEFQCSPISTEYYERHELYQAAGINDYWILGTDKYFDENKRLNTLEKECGIYYNQELRKFFSLNNYLDNISESLGKLYARWYNFDNINEIKKYPECRYCNIKGKRFYFYFMDEVQYKGKIVFKEDLVKQYESIYESIKENMLFNIKDFINNIHEENIDVILEERYIGNYNIIIKNITNEICVKDVYPISINVFNNKYLIYNIAYDNFDDFKKSILNYINVFLGNLEYNLKNAIKNKFYDDLAINLRDYIDSIKDNYCNYNSIEIRNKCLYYNKAIVVYFNHGFQYGIFIKDKSADFAFKIKAGFSWWDNIEKNIDVNNISLLKDKILNHFNNSMAIFDIGNIKNNLAKYNNNIWDFDVFYGNFITDSYYIDIERKYNNIKILTKRIKISKNNIVFENIENLLKDKIKEISQELFNKKDGYYIGDEEYVRFLEV